MAYRVTNRETGAIISHKTYPVMSEAFPEQKRARDRGITADVIFDPRPATREEAGYRPLQQSEKHGAGKLPFGLDRIFGRRHESDLR